MESASTRRMASRLHEHVPPRSLGCVLDRDRSKPVARGDEDATGIRTREPAYLRKLWTFELRPDVLLPADLLLPPRRRSVHHGCRTTSTLRSRSTSQLATRPRPDPLFSRSRRNQLSHPLRSCKHSYRSDNYRYTHTHKYILQIYRGFMGAKPMALRSTLNLQSVGRQFRRRVVGRRERDLHSVSTRSIASV